jgi:hypothetical protein
MRRVVLDVVLALLFRIAFSPTALGLLATGTKALTTLTVLSASMRVVRKRASTGGADSRARRSLGLGVCL